MPESSTQEVFDKRKKRLLEQAGYLYSLLEDYKKYNNDKEYFKQYYDFYLKREWTGVVELEKLKNKFYKAAREYGDLVKGNIEMHELTELVHAGKVNEVRFVINCLEEAWFLVDNFFHLVESEEKDKRNYSEKEFLSYILEYVLKYKDAILVSLLFDDYVEYYMFGNGSKIDSTNESERKWIQEINNLKKKMVSNKQKVNKENIFLFILDVLRNYCWMRNLNGLLDNIDKTGKEIKDKNSKEKDESIEDFLRGKSPIDDYSISLKEIMNNFSVEMEIMIRKDFKINK
eukprot:GAHX01002171.1.p1 GENE.GAHX01002171.1~~GAHX01002171.1.p1  ORF type:complete len:287 (+),score=76.89 GAHX01002171.1:849-1709(+)